MKSPVTTRLTAWQAAHQQLLKDDAHYRNRFRSYVITVVCLSCLLLPFYLTFFGFPLFGFPANIWIILGVTAVIAGLTVRQYRFQIKNIRRFQNPITEPNHS